jgi:hypothetical protein
MDVAKYHLVKVDPFAEQKPRSAFFERAINLHFEEEKKQTRRIQLKPLKIHACYKGTL